MPEFSASLSQQQWATIIIIYGSSIIPSIGLCLAYLLGKLPRWLFAVYVGSFVMCALGWEIWYTYGWVDGLTVNERRPEVMNQAIPQGINWILNSLADAATICMGGLLLVWLLFRRKAMIFQRWHWGAFSALMAIFIGQNLLVELFIYHEQLALGYPMSWAPLALTGPWFNPVLFSIAGRTVQLQSQLPWVLATPIFYYLVIASYRRYQ